jgi:DNA modification methylase
LIDSSIKNESDLWQIKKDSNYKHPTQKPVEIAERAITNSTKRENIITDIFLGSGSTLIAAEKTGRICYGMELDPKYCDVIIKRWEDYTGLKAEKI